MIGAPASAPPGNQRIAIVDIGSNSVRLVIYGPPARVPAILFNEKLMAGLGNELDATGRISEPALAATAGILQRFARLTKAMDVGEAMAVATAAVRDAENGAAIVALAADAGFDVRVLGGSEEAEMAGLGVLSAIPDADGIVGDLGGGSLEFARVRAGRVEQCLSLPLGVLRVPALGPGGVVPRLADGLAAAGWGRAMRDLPFYLVGGSWRALARVDMAATRYPLPMIHHYRIDPARTAELHAAIARGGTGGLGRIRHLPSGRVSTLPAAAALLDAVGQTLAPSAYIASAFGLREGLLYQKLSAAERQADPLIAQAMDLGHADSRFAAHGAALDRWIAPIFHDDPPGWARLRTALCHLSDVAWRAHPDFRSHRAVEIALHGNWVAVDGAGREMLAQGLSSCFGGGTGPFRGYGQLADGDAVARAAAWGLALRLGQRLSGGTEGPLAATRLSISGDSISGDRLVLGYTDDAALAGDMVSKRLAQLAAAMGLKPLECF